MNAGAQGKFLSCCVRRVAALYRGEAVLLSAQECGFSYKKTRFMEGDWVVMAAELELPRQERNSVLEEVRSTLLWRRRLPRGKSMGCIFKNPPGDSAGRLIEKCGWKGASCGDAYVSEAHANFIINRANASSEDFKTLIRKIRESVLRNTGIVLSEEIRYIGES